MDKGKIFCEAVFANLLEANDTEAITQPGIVFG